MAQRPHGLRSRLVHEPDGPESTHAPLRHPTEGPHPGFASFPPAPDLLEDKPGVPANDQVDVRRLHPLLP